MDNQQRDKIPSKVFAAIVATELMSFSGVIVETSMNIAFPTLMRQFGISTNVVSWMTSIYLLAISIIVPISTILKGSCKTKNLFLTANILFLIGLIIDALAPSFVILLLGRVIQGIATGIALPIVIALVAGIFLVKRTQKLAHPLLDLQLLKNKYFAASVLGFFLIQMCSLGNALLIPNYVQLVNGNTAMVAGLLVLPAGCFGALMGPIGGRLLDKHGA